eukprot:3137967-Alexandrium_andersonii.AAC.1
MSTACPFCCYNHEHAGGHRSSMSMEHVLACVSMCWCAWKQHEHVLRCTEQAAGACWCAPKQHEHLLLCMKQSLCVGVHRSGSS